MVTLLRAVTAPPRAKRLEFVDRFIDFAIPTLLSNFMFLESPT
jgi:hypothetical protein